MVPGLFPFCASQRCLDAWRARAAILARGPRIQSLAMTLQHGTDARGPSHLLLTLLVMKGSSQPPPSSGCQVHCPSCWRIDETHQTGPRVRTRACAGRSCTCSFLFLRCCTCRMAQSPPFRPPSLKRNRVHKAAFKQKPRSSKA